MENSKFVKVTFITRGGAVFKRVQTEDSLKLLVQYLVLRSKSEDTRPPVSVSTDRSFIDLREVIAVFEE